MTSLLVLTQPLQRIVPCLPKVLKEASKYTTKRLYIHLDQLALKQSLERHRSLPYRSYVISSIYSICPGVCPDLDIRVFMYGFKQTEEVPPTSFKNIEKVLLDSQTNETDMASIERRYKLFLKAKNLLILDSEEDDIDGKSSPDHLNSCGTKEANSVYDDVVVGGTFDRLHSGHKILLSEALLRTRTRLTVGMADGALLKRKILKELIEPCSERIAKLLDFLTDVDCHVDFNLVPIEEPMGPTSWDPKMQMIVVSEETKKGADLINKYRKDHGLNMLDSLCIKLFEDTARTTEEEEVKFSSSSQRMRLLGKRLRNPSPNVRIPQTPYIIGLTGGSASGKTKIAKRLASLGAGVVDCDILGHQAYTKGTQCYFDIIETFGKEVLDTHQEIDRKILGSLVFNDKYKLDLLNKIVWPEIYKLSDREIKKMANDGKKVVVLDAAVLLEAEWDQYCHEVWVSVIQREEAIRRIMDRDKKSEAEAAKRIDSQMSNEDRISKAHIVFCSQWAYEYTQSQVQKAWNILVQKNKL